MFAYGVPYYCYPVSGYYDAAPYYGPYDGSYYAPYGASYDTPYYAPGPATEYTSDPDTQTEQYANQDADSYYQPGYQWGGELKSYHVTMDQFVAYLKSNILGASPVQQAAFRSGFVAHFGGEGQTIYDQAVQLASQQG